MTDDRFVFLRALLDAPGPSGFETRAARVWREEAERFADEVRTDVQGNTLATLNGEGRPRVMLAGHIDEIGLMITHIDDEGFVYLDGIGGWDSQVLVGQRLRILTRSGEVMGVIGKQPIHLMSREDREKVSKLSDLWVDLGVRGRSEIAELGVRIGDPAVIDARLIELANGLIASRSIDNRIGAFVVLEVLRELHGETTLTAKVTAAATMQEEIAHSGGGARTAAYVLEPEVALAVDVTFATDSPGIEKKQVGERKLGGGPVLSRGSAINTEVVEMLIAVAEAEKIPVTLKAAPGATHTDADAIFLSRAGVPTAVVSVPNRYMHSPNEVVAKEDLEASIRLIAAFVRRLNASTDFTPRLS